LKAWEEKQKHLTMTPSPTEHEEVSNYFSYACMWCSVSRLIFVVCVCNVTLCHNFKGLCDMTLLAGQEATFQGSVQTEIQEGETPSSES